MKNSEIIKTQLEEEDNDFKALGLMTKVMREERIEKFEDTYLSQLRTITKVEQRENGSYTFNSEFGIIDFFPKTNNLLFRSTGRWKKPGLKFIIEKILKQ